MKTKRKPLTEKQRLAKQRRDREDRQRKTAALGRHRYGVRFSDGAVYPEADVRLPSDSKEKNGLGPLESEATE